MFSYQRVGLFARPRAQWVRRRPGATRRQSRPYDATRRANASPVEKVTGGSMSALKALRLPSLPKFSRPANLELPDATTVLNCGMGISLLGMCCSDILALRGLSFVGGCCGMYFNYVQPKPLWVPVRWGLLFAGVNLVNIGFVLQERYGDFNFCADDAAVYNMYLKPAGAAPVPSSRILAGSTTRQYKEGEVVVSKGEEVDALYFIIKGSARVVVGRRADWPSMKAGSPSAVIGDMSLLDELSRRSQEHIIKYDEDWDKDCEKNECECPADEERHLAAATVLAGPEGCWCRIVPFEQLVNSSLDDAKLLLTVQGVIASSTVAKLLKVNDFREGRLHKRSTLVEKADHVEERIEASGKKKVAQNAGSKK